MIDTPHFANLPIFWLNCSNEVPGVCMGFYKPLLGDVRFMLFAWGFTLILLEGGFFERIAWGDGFLGLLCSGTSILAPLLLGVLLGVDLLGAVKQGCLNKDKNRYAFTAGLPLNSHQADLQILAHC